MNTTATAILDQVQHELLTGGWSQRWANTYMFDDQAGNTVWLSMASDDLVHVEFEYALPGVVETMNLDAAPSLAARESTFGARRIASVINALALPDDE